MTLSVPGWCAQGGEDVVGGVGQARGGRRRPLRLMVTSWRGLRVRMMRLMLIPVASWR